MGQWGAESSKQMSRILWAVASIALIMCFSAIYFAFRAHKETLNALASAKELSLKKQELEVAKQELVRAKSGVAISGPVLVSPAVEQAKTAVVISPTSFPAAKNSPDGSAVLRSPAVRQITRQGRLAMLRPIYDPLLTQLNLSLEQRSRFYDLQLEFEDPGATLDKLPSEAATPEERAQIEAHVRQISDSALAQLQEMLGSRAYRLYETYRNTEGERLLVQQFRQQVDAKSMQISDWQYDRLRDLLIQSHTQYPPASGDMTAAHEAAVTQAAQFLTPQQLAVFRDYLHNQDEMARAIRKLYPPGD